MTPKETKQLIEWLLQYSVDDVWKKKIAPLILKQSEANFPYSRLVRLTEGDLRKFALKVGLNKNIKPGAADFTETRRLVDELRSKGYMVYLKLPGEDPGSCSTIPDCVRKYLTKKDLFLFVQTELQARLMEKYGIIIGTDGTHGTLSYGNLKLISLFVTTYDEDESVDERGFPVGLIISTSERTDVHKAAITCVRLNVREDWKPKLIMSDMAFSAFNAWSEIFTGIHWLWCVFHVWQAWHKKIKQAPRPNGMNQDDYARIRGHLLHQMLHLICPSESKMSWAEFDSLANDLRKIMLAKGFVPLVESFDTYLKNKDRWAPPARREAVEAIFGKGCRLPMLAKSNNCVESFFRVLKWVLLKGKCSLTLASLLGVWDEHQARIRVNLCKCGVLLNELIRSTRVQLYLEDGSKENKSMRLDLTSQSAELTGIDKSIIDSVAEMAEQNQILDDDDDDENECTDDSSDSDGPDVEENDDGPEGGNKTAVWPSIVVPNLLRQSLEAERSAASSLNNRIGDLSTRLEALRIWNDKHPNQFESHKKTLSSSIGSLCQCIDIATGLTIDVSEVEMGGVKAFVKQAGNYGTSIAEDILETSAEVLNKVKRKSKKKNNVKDVSDEAFEKFRDEIFAEEDFEVKLRDAEANYNCLNFRTLRSALERNTSKRLYGIATFILGLSLSTSLRKSKIIDSIVKVIDSQGLKVPDLELVVADVGVVVEDNLENQLFKGEVVWLKANSTTNLGDSAVTVCLDDPLRGYVTRGNSTVVEIEVLPKLIRWGRLSENCKTLDDLK